MAIYHAHIKSFSRGKGESSVAAAAYRAGIDLTDTTKRIEHRYSQRKGVQGFHMLAPAGAPDWCRDARVFWDANEAWETRANARVARELEVSLPAELDDAQREQLAVALGQALVDRYQAAVLVAIHAPSAQGDQRNHHVHLLMSARQVGSGGLGERAGTEFDARQGKGAEAVREVRAWVGALINDHLARAGLAEKVDHRTLRAQAAEAAALGDAERARELDRRPSQHVGKVATAKARKEAAVAPMALSDEELRAVFDASVAQAEREGRLVATPAGHSHDRAVAERGSSHAGAAEPSARPAPLARSEVRRQSWPRETCPSPIALRLSRAARLARTLGRDAEVLNSEAEIIEGWLETQREANQAALDAVLVIPGVQLEPAFREATEALAVRRVDAHGHKPDFYEDTEALTRAVRDYSVAMREPHDARVALTRARAKFSEAETDTSRLREARIRSAQRALTRAKKGVSMVAGARYEKKINAARREMVAARTHLMSVFPVSAFEALVHENELAAPATLGAQAGAVARELRPHGPRPH